MEVQFKTVRKLLLEEYEELFQETQRCVKKNLIADACHEMVWIGYYAGKQAIERATNFDELNDAVSFCGYRMSLEEWLNSL